MIDESFKMFVSRTMCILPSLPHIAAIRQVYCIDIRQWEKSDHTVRWAAPSSSIGPLTTVTVVTLHSDSTLFLPSLFLSLTPGMAAVRITSFARLTFIYRTVDLVFGRGQMRCEVEKREWSHLSTDIGGWLMVVMVLGCDFFNAPFCRCVLGELACLLPAAKPVGLWIANVKLGGLTLCYLEA